MLKEFERLEDLQFKDLKIIQSSNEYCFTSDAVRLFNHIKLKKQDKALELCSGSAVIAILLAGKFSNLRSVTCVEIQKNLCDMANRSVDFNKMQDKIKILNCDISALEETLGLDTFDIVYINPPYFKNQACKKNLAENIAIARHEIYLDLDMICSVANKFTKFGGKFYIVYPVDRMAEAIFKLKNAKLEPKVLHLYTLTKDCPQLFVLECHKNGKEGLKCQVHYT